MSDLSAFGVDVPEAEEPTGDEHVDRVATDADDDYRYTRPQCQALTAAGDRCSNPVRRAAEATFCPRHHDADVATIDDRGETDA